MPSGCWHLDHAYWLGLWANRHPPSPFTVMHWKADTNFTIAWRLKGRVDLSTALSMCSSCPRQCITVVLWQTQKTAHNPALILGSCARLCQACYYSQGQHWLSITLPPNNLPLKMAASGLRFNEVPLYCWDSPVVICMWNSSSSFDDIILNILNFPPITISLFCYEATY